MKIEPLLYLNEEDYIKSNEDLIIIVTKKFLTEEYITDSSV